MATERTSKDMLQEVNPLPNPVPNATSCYGSRHCECCQSKHFGVTLLLRINSFSNRWPQYRRRMELPLPALQRIRDDFVQQARCISCAAVGYRSLC